MTTNFPTSLDSFTNPNPTDTLGKTGVKHSDEHSNANDAIRALQVKLGINGSSDTSSVDYKLALAATQSYVNSAISTALSTAEGYTDNAISAEITNRNSAISSAISAEVINRNNAISSAIGTEVTNRNSAISTEVTNRNSAISSAISTQSVTDASTYATIANLALKAPIASPTFTGTVTIPAGASISGYLTSSTAASTYAPINSPTFTGTPKSVTPLSSDNSTNIATTAFVNNIVGALSTGVSSISGTTNQISVSGSTGNITLSLPNSVTLPGDLVVTGNLTINGSQEIVNSTNMSVTDSIIYLSDQNFNSDSLDIGFYGAYGYTGHTGDPGHVHTGLVRNHIDKKWYLFSNGAEPASSTVDLSTANLDTLKAGIFEGSGASLTSIPNSALTNNSITVNGSSISLGGSGTISAKTTNALTIGTGLSGTSFDGSSAVTISNSGVLSVNGLTGAITNVLQSTSVVPDATSSSTAASPGFLGMPVVNNNSAEYIITFSDAGKMLYNTYSVAPAAFSLEYHNGDVLSIGSAISFANNSGGICYLNIGPGIGMLWNGTINYGGRTFANYSTATILKIDTNLYILNGTGIS